ncbi:hypothetical protein, partial [Bacillus subtilis]|uniref:hypothetical protein n=1 Tax=Bacillus subtilis TaxID=1423 RepID=UPI001BDBABBD
AVYSRSPLYDITVSWINFIGNILYRFYVRRAGNSTPRLFPTPSGRLISQPHSYFCILPVSGDAARMFQA